MVAFHTKLPGTRPAKLRSGDANSAIAGPPLTLALLGNRGNGAVCVGAFMGQLDASIVTLALPTLQRTFHAGLGAVTWVGLSYLLVLVDPADRGSADPVAGLEELALDPLVPPERFSVASRPMSAVISALTAAARPVRISRLARDQPAMPPEHGAGCHQPVHPQRSGQGADQRGEHRAVVRSSRGRGWVRRSTATSCRSTSSSMSLDAVERPSRTSQPQSRTRGRPTAVTADLARCHFSPVARVCQGPDGAGGALFPCTYSPYGRWAVTVWPGPGLMV